MIQRRRGGRLAGAVLALTVMMAGLTAIPTAAGAAEPARTTVAPSQLQALAPAVMSAFDQQMLSLINSARAANGRTALSAAYGLNSVALAWSNQLNSGATGYQLQHDPDAWTQVAANGAANRTTWGENVAWSSSSSTSAQDIFTAYMNSPGHRANILSASYHYVGLGTAFGSHGLWNTTEFTDKVQPGQAFLPAPDPGHAPAPMTTATARALVGAWFVDVLGRPAETTALAVRGNNLVAGQPKPEAVKSLVVSTEGLNRLSRSYYQLYVGRPATAAGLTYAISMLHSNRPMVLAANLLGSAETLHRAGSTAAWVKFVYRVALGRSPSAADIARWSAAVARSGTKVVAATILNGAEGAGYRVNQYFQRFLDRPADASGRAAWAKSISSSGDFTVQINLLSSGEYASHHS